MKFYVFIGREEWNIHSTYGYEWSLEPVLNSNREWRTFDAPDCDTVIRHFRAETACEEHLFIIRTDDLMFHGFVHQVDGECLEDSYAID